MADMIANNGFENFTNPAPAPAPAKRSLFKKSQWATPTESLDGVDLFSRAKELFPTVAADSEKRRKDNKRKSDSEKADRAVEDEAKRKRVSIDDQPIARTSQDQRGSIANRPSSSPSMKNRESPPKARRLYPSTKAACENTPTPPSVISLGDSSDEESSPRAAKFTQLDFDDYDGHGLDIEPRKPPPRRPEPSVIEEISEEEDPFAEFVTKAREDASRSTHFTRLPAPGRIDTDLPSSDNSGTLRATSTFQLRAAEPIINIFVTSQINGTSAINFKRKLSQRIKDVRVNWCDRQLVNGRALDEEEKRNIFLTWRGNRLFDVSTGKSMGLHINAAGSISAGGANGDGFNDGRIHLEAWTEELFSEFEKQRRIDQRRRAHNPLDETEAEEEVAEPQEEAVPIMKIFIKAKGLKDFRVVVKPHTPVAKMIHAFKSFHELPPESEVVLRFDGDKLEPESVAGDADLDDMSSVDAYVHGGGG